MRICGGKCQDPAAASRQGDWSGVGWGECRRQGQRLTGSVYVCVCVGDGGAWYTETDHV